MPSFEGRPHGQYTITVNSPIVVIRFIDVWNAELMPVLCKDFMERVSRELLPSARYWGVIADVTDFLGQPRESMAAWEDILNWCSDNGQIAAALVGPHFFVGMSEAIEQARKAPIERQSFKDVEAAEQWIRALITRRCSSEQSDVPV